MKDIHPRLCVIATVLIAGLSHAAPPDELFDQLYGRQYRSAVASSDTTDNVVLARELMAAARASEDADTIVLLTEKVYELVGTNADGLALAVEAMQLQADTSDDKAPQARARLVELLPRHYATATGEAKTEAGSLLVDLLIAGVERHLEAGEADEAMRMVRRAAYVTRGLPENVQQDVKALQERVAHLRRVHLQIDTLKQRIERTPDNTALIDQLALLYLLDLEDPAKAAEFAEVVSKPLGEKLKLAAQPTDELSLDQLIEMGEWYPSLSPQAAKETRPALHRRALAYLQTYLDRDPPKDLRYTKVERMVEKANKLTTVADADSQLDLLQNFNVAEAAVAGKWVLDDGKLTTTDSSDASFIVFPHSIRGDYTLDLSFLRFEGTARIVIAFPVGNHSVHLAIGRGFGVVSGLEMIDNEDIKSESNPTALPTKFPNNTVYRITVAVNLLDNEQASVTAFINRKKLVEWKGKRASLSIPAGPWQEINKHRIGFGSFESKIALLHATVTPSE